jgi:hypothetical protein
MRVKTKKVNGADVEVKYRVIQVDPKGRLLVRYFNDDMPEGYLHWVDLPVVNGEVRVLEGDALDDYVIGAGPVAELARAKAPLPDLSSLQALVEADHVPPPAPPPQPTPSNGRIEAIRSREV